MPLIEAPPPLLAAESPGAAFLASGQKRGFKGVWAEVNTNELFLCPYDKSISIKVCVNWYDLHL
ncbi:hypothetical protein [Nostoc sp.]|uniref:hypothetical protein n=1 Tax=Nostoc sp. TaxID=1180 RepID=UPI002FFABE67